MNDIITPRSGDGPITLSAELYDLYHDMYVALLAENQQLRKALLGVQLTEINGRLCARPEPPDPLFDNPDAPRESKCCPACRKLWEQIDAALARVEKSE